MDRSKVSLKFSRSLTREANRWWVDEGQGAVRSHLRTIHYVEETSVDKVLVSPSQKFLDGCATVENLTLSRENEDDRFCQFGDKQVSPSPPLSKFKGR